MSFRHEDSEEERSGCEVGFEKAYGRVNWQCLFDVLEKMGFDDRWIGWIRAYISSVTFTVLVNWKPSSPFYSGRGLRL